MTEINLPDLAEAIDAGPVPAHLLLEVDDDAEAGEDGTDDAVSTGAVAVEAVDAGPPPDDLLALAHDSEADEEAETVPEGTEGA